jgi:hypothetical protein
LAVLTLNFSFWRNFVSMAAGPSRPEEFSLGELSFAPYEKEKTALFGWESACLVGGGQQEKIRAIIKDCGIEVGSGDLLFTREA